MKKERKILHLNRTILFVVMIGYSAFLVLMLWMDFYLIRQYQNENRREAQQAMNSYIEQIMMFMLMMKIFRRYGKKRIQCQNMVMPMNCGKRYIIG